MCVYVHGPGSIEQCADVLSDLHPLQYIIGSKRDFTSKQYKAIVSTEVKRKGLENINAARNASVLFISKSTVKSVAQY